MLTQNVNLLVVEDDVQLGQALAVVLGVMGYRVRLATDGFSALAAIRQEAPDIVLSDLNMPGMSGYELLSVIRRRFPLIRVVAMSGAYLGNSIPPGVLADAFHEKGGSPTCLFSMLEAMTAPDQPPPVRSSVAPLVWIPRNGQMSSGNLYVTLSCPECLRTFLGLVGDVASHPRKVDCVHCSSPIEYAIVDPNVVAMQQPTQWRSGSSSSTNWL